MNAPIEPIPPPPARTGRRIAGRAQRDPFRDPYQARLKPRAPTICRHCRAVFRDGRWRWDSRPADAAEALCPACRRIDDNLPAGIVTVHAPDAAARSDIVAVARHQEEAEREEHPLNRIMRIEEQADALIIATTDIHLPRRIVEALQRAFGGDVDMRFDAERYFMRADWQPPR